MASDTKRAAKRSQLTSPWQDFVKAFEKLTPLSKIIIEAETPVQDAQQLQAQIDDLISQISSLKAQHKEDLAVYERKIEDLDKTREILITDFQKKHIEWIEERNKSKAQAQKSYAAQIFAKDNELRTLCSEQKDLQNQISEMKQTLASTKAELEENSAAFVGTSELLRQAQSNIAILEDQIGFQKSSFRQISSELTDLQSNFHALSRHYFGKDLPPDTSQDGIFEEIIPLMKMLCQSIAVSNSPASKGSRIAAAEALITKVVCRNIFRTPFHPRSLDTTTLSKTCQWMTQSPQPARGIALHMQLAASMQPNEIEEIVKATTMEVLGLIAPLLQGREKSFAEELDALLIKAAQLWRRLQRTEFRVVADTIADEKSLASGENSAQKPSSQSQPSDFFRPYLIIFPRIMVDNETQTLHRGCVIWSSSRLALDAMQEAAKQLKRVQALQSQLKRTEVPRLGAESVSSRAW